MQLIIVQESDFDPAALQAQLRDACAGSAGAIATFTGYVRDYAPDRPTAALHLEHYPGMCERELAEIGDAAAARWNIAGYVIAHRVGALARNAQIVFVATASAQRSASGASSRPCSPTIATPLTPSISSTWSRGRPLTHATRAYRPASRASSRRVSSGMRASSGRSTIGASVPSTSSRIAARRGSSVSASSRWSAISSDPRIRAVRPDAMPLLVRLALIGLVAGVFSAVFGVGGGIVLDGRLLEGAAGNAGHVGHVVVVPDGRSDERHSPGVLEAEASGSALAAITGRPAAEATPDVIARTGRLVGRAAGSVGESSGRPREPRPQTASVRTERMHQPALSRHRFRGRCARGSPRPDGPACERSRTPPRSGSGRSGPRSRRCHPGIRPNRVAGGVRRR